MRALLVLATATATLRRLEIIPGYREASVWSHDGKRVSPTSPPSVTGCRFLYPECEKVCVNETTSYVLENTTFEVTTLGQQTCYLTLTNKSHADELFSPSLFPDRLEVVECPETVCEYNAGQYRPKVEIRTVEGEADSLKRKVPVPCKEKYPACKGTCTETREVRTRGYDTVQEEFAKKDQVYMIGFACWKAVDENCTVDRCLKWPQAWIGMENVDCPGTGGSDKEEDAGSCVFVQDCVEVIVNGEKTEKCTGDEDGEAGASEGDSGASDSASLPSHEAPWRPFETRFMAGRKCYGADWAIRQATDPDAVRADCEPLGQEQCQNSSSCLWRTDSPVWYYRARQAQSEGAHPYLRTHDNPPAGLVHPEPDSTVLRARYG